MLPSIKAAEEKLVKDGWNGVHQKEYAGITGIKEFVDASLAFGLCHTHCRCRCLCVCVCVCACAARTRGCKCVLGAYMLLTHTHTHTGYGKNSVAIQEKRVAAAQVLKHTEYTHRLVLYTHIIYTQCTHT